MSGAVRALRRVSRRAVAAEPRCELCHAVLGEEHGHVADVEAHRLLCACRACSLLFAPSGAGGGRYRAVSGEVRALAGVELDRATWAALGVPVDVVFFLALSDGEVTACYPGPAGAVESEVDPDVWLGVLAANPVLATAAPGVEAVLVRRSSGGDSVDACYLLPVDRCYELVGLVRSWWSGPDGGAAVWAGLTGWFDELDRVAVGPASGGAAWLG